MNLREQFIIWYDALDPAVDPSSDFQLRAAFYECAKQIRIGRACAELAYLTFYPDPRGGSKALEAVLSKHPEMDAVGLGCDFRVLLHEKRLWDLFV